MRLSMLPEKTGSRGRLTTIPLLAVMLTLVFLTVSASAASIKQKTFTSPDKAVQTFVDSLRKADKTSIKAILGPAGDQLASSGDPVEDSRNRERFLAAYDEAKRLDRQGKNRAVLVIGNDAWPFPIPLVMKNKRWRFDTAAGKQEILNRWIGRNELETIQTCLAVMDAQQEYAMNGYAGKGKTVYAAKFMSDPGKKNGLYWETAEGEEPSPLGELVAEAKVEGYTGKKSGQGPSPYHGYLYRILTRQGTNATGGAYDYMVNGELVLGNALIAYPAQYGVSGVMTFITNHDGVVYQKDLGPKTGELAAKIDTFDPGTGWKKVDTETTAAK
jgi:hypothetical protein